MKLLTGVFAGVALCQLAAAAEVTVQNDSLTNFGTAVIVAGFIPGEKGASWLTSPCEGNIVAVQILWLSTPGGAPDVLGDSIDIYRAGTYPNPGALAQEIVAPLLTEGVINEYRYLDDDSTVPLIVPVAANETFVVAYQFSETAVAGGPSLVRDTNGITAGRNAIYANLGGSNFAWFSSEGLGVTGDWVIRAVIDCPTGGTQADVHSAISTTPDLYVPGAAISHEITVGNSGPGNASSVIVVDTFPASYTGVTWSCAASGGATCTSGGSGNLAQVVSLPNGGAVTYTVNATVGAGTSGVISNTVTAVVNAPASDPDTSNNSATADTAPLSDRIFADDFDL